MSRCLGLQITRHDDGSVFVCQESYTKMMLEKLSMMECNVLVTLISQKTVSLHQLIHYIVKRLETILIDNEDEIQHWPLL